MVGVMKALVVTVALLGAFLAEHPVSLKPWVTETKLKSTLSQSALDLSRYFEGASFDRWLKFVHGLTPQAKINLSLFGREIKLDGQAEIAKTIRHHQTLFSGLRLKATNAVVEREAGRLASVLVQAVIADEAQGVSEPIMLRLGLIKINSRWLIHHVQTVEGYMSLR